MIEKGKISSSQMALIMYPTITATAILLVPAITARHAGKDMWLSPIWASMIGFFTVYIAIRLNKLYPKETIIEYSVSILGPILGKVIGFIYLLFLIHITGMILREYADFIIGNFYVRTPMTVVMAGIVLVSALAVYGGLEVIARTSQVFVPLMIILFASIIILLFPDFKTQNILPILENGIMPSIKGAITPSSWFSEFILISFMLPFLSDRSKGMKWGMLSVCSVMLTLAITNLSSMLVLSDLTEKFTYPVMIYARYISIADFLEHLDSIVMAIWILGTFIKISAFYYALSLGTAQWLKLSDFRPVVLPYGLILVLFGIWSAANLQEMAHFLGTTGTFYLLSIQILIPLLLLLVAVLKKDNRHNKRIKTLLIFVICIGSIPLAGCWDRQEINDVAIVIASGIDKRDDDIIDLSAQIIVPKVVELGSGGGGGEEKPTYAESSEGTNIGDGTSKLQQKLSRKVFYGHCKTIIIGEELAKDGIAQHLDFYVRHPDTRLRTQVFVSKGYAKDILELIPPLEMSSGEMAREMAAFRTGMNVTLKDLMLMLSSEEKAAAVPWLELTKSDSNKNGVEKETIMINGIGVLKNGKLIGYLDDKLTRGVLWIRDEIEDATVTITPKEEKGQISVYQYKADTKLIPKIIDDKWHITIEALTEDDLLQNSTKLDISDAGTIKMLEQLLADAVKKRIEEALKKVQKELNADILGFGDAFHKKYPKEWNANKERWDEIFPRIQVDVNVKAFIRRPGMITMSSQHEKEEVKDQ